MQNNLVWKLARSLSDKYSEFDQHYGFSGVKTHENGIFLYKSDQADYVLKSRVIDYLVFGSFFGMITGISHFLALPLFAASLSLPRKWSAMRYFTFHAELLPHTEQIVFHKSTLFGEIDRHFVDIRNLEKIDASEVPNTLLFSINTFDSQFVWRDAETNEVFVFDTDGIWNAEALEHPLLY